MELTYFTIVVSAAVVVSFLCSLTEAALYSVPLAWIKTRAETGSNIGRLLASFKADMGRPIAAILVLNTLATSAGAALSGALATRIWGQQAVGWLALGFTLLILFVSEITPKIIGVSYCRPVAWIMALPLYACIKLLFPLMWISRVISRALEPAEERPLVSQEEVLSLAAIGTEEGALDRLEGSVISNVIELDQLLVRDVLTPRVVVFRLQEDCELGSLIKDMESWSFTRIPLYSAEDPDHLTSYVMQLEMYRALSRGQTEKKLSELARPLNTVPELMRADRLLTQMLERNEQICSVVDEYGSLAGIITLEDLLEEIVGHEIIDEYDTVGDLRSLAGLLGSSRARRAQSSPPDEGRGYVATPANSSSSGKIKN